MIGKWLLLLLWELIWSYAKLKKFKRLFNTKKDKMLGYYCTAEQFSNPVFNLSISAVSLLLKKNSDN